jgi:FG-GAP repeat/PEP-CTERM motif
MRRTNWIRITCTAAIIAACSLAGIASATTWTETDKLIASDGAERNYFGASVAVEGNTAIITAPGHGAVAGYSGVVRIYEKNATDWSQTARLVLADGVPMDHFGDSVGLSGNTAIVGVSHIDDNGEDSGAAYIYENGPSGWGLATQLLASDGAALDRFGRCVAISGNTVIIGANRDDDNGTNSGSAYIFKNDGSGWAQVAKLTASDAAQEDEFGISVAISGNTAIVGASATDDAGSKSGSAYVFENDGSGWAQVAKLTASDAAQEDEFGISVAISDGVAIVGAEHNDDDGAAYIFSDDGSGWAQVAKLAASDASTDDYFGTAVSISGNTAIVGAEGDDDLGDESGSAYVFRNDGATWYELGKLTASDGAAVDKFGHSVAVDGSMIVVGSIFDDDKGAYSGSAYTFDAPASEPVPEPLSMIFFGTGVVGVFGFVSRRKMQKSA